MLKKIYLLFFLISLLTTITFGQVGTQVDYSDSFFSGTLSYNGLVNGKHSYTESGSDNITIAWDGSRWEITSFSESFLLIAHSDQLTDLNPPNTDFGLYVVDDQQYAPISVEGTGTTGPLPVELISFSVVNDNQNLDLIWQTASELNNHYFQVEHSTDARSFTPIGVVDGKGTTNESQNYHYRHLAPRFGQNYYRLKQVDFDGTFAYSDLVNVNYKSKGDIHPIVIYPNPVSDELSLTNISSGDLILEVFNVLGEFQFKAKLAEGQNKEFPTDHLMDGSYFIRIKTEHEYLKQKFIKISR